MRGILTSMLAAVAAGGIPSAVLAEKPLTAADRSFRSFVPPVRPVVPSVENEIGALGEIDRFVLSRLERRGLKFAPEADRRTLIRRVTFDLTGLPPSPEEVENFVGDDAPDAYVRVVDRLLAAQAFGERQAQDWLDAVRFAESDGYEHDAIRPEAWRFRDWVIAALNADMPYDQFLQWQLAGDELDAGNPDARVATGFLVAGPDMPDMNLQEERRHQVLNGMTATVGEVCLGLTLGCAQCHDHKTDPVSTDDFYRLRAVFSNTVASLVRDQQLELEVREPGAVAPGEFVRIRGDFNHPGAVAYPGFPRVLNPENSMITGAAKDAVSSGRRTQFARWLTRAEHPLTSRVEVNRLWQHHFGKGLVASPGDFGHTGEAPVNPDLLDWLATELPARGWSLKAIHRLIVTSRVYRQASVGAGPEWAAALALDPDNRLLSRWPRRRLEGEEIRDSFLAVAGLLNRDGGGPGVRPPLPEAVTANLLKNQWKVTPDPSSHRRRSVYLFVRRNLRFPLFEVFDRPDSNMACARRDRSVTAPQSLTLLNGDFSQESAQALASRVSAEASVLNSEASGKDGIRGAYALLFSRPPTAPEAEAARQFLASRPEDERGMTLLCLALLNTNEAIYID